MGSLKDKAIFAAEVLVVFAAVYFIQQNVMSVPLVGQYLPGYKPAAAS
jgi:hypothetical protein